MRINNIRAEENYSCGEQGPEGRELGGRTKRQLAGAEEPSAEKTGDKCPRQGRKSRAPRSASRGPRGSARKSTKTRAEEEGRAGK